MTGADGAPPSPSAVALDGDAVGAHRRQLRAAVLRGVVGPTALLVTFVLLPLRGDRWWVGVAVGSAVLVGFVPFTVALLRRVLRSERPVFEAFEAVVQLLCLLVVAFASIYYAMNRDGTQIDGVDTRLDAVYFTVTTLATVGFGDLVPVSQAARAVVTAQIVFDLVFLGVVVRVFGRVASR